MYSLAEIGENAVVIVEVV